jgi:membrane associated rhomboid family serine protease
MMVMAIGPGEAAMQPVQSMIARIPARSRRQAMDWSLALVSQDIETTIDHSEEAGWGLIVAAQDYERALGVIRQYRVENLHWPWRQKISRQGVLFDWGSLAWVFLLGLFYWIGENAADLRSLGLMDGAAVSHGEWWRLFTAIFLHADLGHLAENAGIGLVLLGLAMGRYGTGVGLLAACLAGVGGNVATWLVHSEGHRSLGASGMVMGSLGLLAAQSVAVWRGNPKAAKYILSGIAAGAMLFVLMGLSPGTDVAAHFGGFIAGLLLGSILTQAPRLAGNTAVNIFAGALFCLLVILTWWLAIARPNQSFN